MMEKIYRGLYPAKIRQLEKELAANKKALRYAVAHFTDLQGHKVTNQDVLEFLNNVKKLQGVSTND